MTLIIGVKNKNDNLSLLVNNSPPVLLSLDLPLHPDKTKED